MTLEKRPVQTVRTSGGNASPTMAPRPSPDDIAHLSVYLPARLRGHDNTSSFLEEVARAALEALDTCTRLPAKEVRSALGELVGCAHAFMTALGALRDPQIDRQLKLHLDGSAELVDRLRGDVQALVVGCEYAVKSLEGGGATTPPASQAARGLVVRVAMAIQGASNLSLRSAVGSATTSCQISVSRSVSPSPALTSSRWSNF